MHNPPADGSHAPAFPQNHRKGKTVWETSLGDLTNGFPRVAYEKWVVAGVVGAPRFQTANLHKLDNITYQTEILMSNLSPIETLQSAFPSWQTSPTAYPANVVPYPGVNQFFLEGPAYHGKPTRIFGFWQLPEGADAAHPVPGIVLIHGGGGTALPDWVQLWNQRGFAAIAVDNCGKVPAWSLYTRYNTAWPQHEFSGPDGWDPACYAQTDEPFEDQWPFHAVAANILAHSFLRAQPGVDADRIGLGGISWGGVITLWTAAIDHRFRFAIPVYGTGFWERESKYIPEGGCDYGVFCKWCDLWDPANFVSRIPMSTLLFGSTNDYHFPIDTAFKTAHAIGDHAWMVERPEYPHDHFTPDREEICPDFARAVLTGHRLHRPGKPHCEGNTLVAEYDAAGRKVIAGYLLYTRATGCWTDRRFQAKRATLREGVLSCELPPMTTAAFFNLEDDRHYEIASDLWER